MLDEYILNWVPKRDVQPHIRSFGRFGPDIIQAKTGGLFEGLCVSTGELPDSTKLVLDAEKCEVPPAVQTWRLSHANAKIRKDAHVSRFKSCEGTTGALHSAQLPNSSACEDASDARIVGKRLYAGIYDGHAGWATSQTLKTSLVPFVAKELRHLQNDSSQEVNDAIVAGFKKLDDSILDIARTAVTTASPCDSKAMSAIAPAVSGSCALLSIFEAESSTIRVACVGDSRAVLGKHVCGEAGELFEMKPLSVDQTGENKDEISRVEMEHPGENELFQDGRLLGIMVTRAFGDHRWKWDEDLVDKAYREFFGLPATGGVSNPPYLTAEPAITTTTVSARDFAILASDGLWEHMTSENAVLCVAEWIKKKQQQRMNVAGENHSQSHTSQFQDSSIIRDFELDFDDDIRTWKCLPEHFVVEDMDNAAVHLLKNALGGKRRNLFVATTMMHQPLAKAVHDDITVQVLFFGEGLC